MLGSNKVRGLSLRKIAPEIAPPLRSNSITPPTHDDVISQRSPDNSDLLNDVCGSHMQLEEATEAATRKLSRTGGVESEQRRRGRQLADVIKQMYAQALSTVPVSQQKTTQENEVDMLTNVLVNSLFTCTGGSLAVAPAPPAGISVDPGKPTPKVADSNTLNLNTSRESARSSKSAESSEGEAKVRRSSVPTPTSNTLTLSSSHSAGKLSTATATATATVTVTAPPAPDTFVAVAKTLPADVRKPEVPPAPPVAPQPASLPPDGDRCARCKQLVKVDLPEGSSIGCSYALDRVYHNMCFDCMKCGVSLVNQPYFAWNERLFCERCYVVCLETCTICKTPICDRIIRALGQPYHSQCFRCARCDRCLDGVAYTVTASNQIYCLRDFYERFAIRCAACGEPIVPDDRKSNGVVLRDFPGLSQSATLGTRVVAMDCSFHVECFRCTECGVSMVSADGSVKSSSTRLCDVCRDSRARHNLIAVHEVEV